MSITQLQSPNANPPTTVLLSYGRNIAGIYPDCVIEERHIDSVEITNHPVEQGASISDHAFKKPAEVTMRMMWSESPSTPAFLGTPQSGVLKYSMQEVYSQLQNLQANLQPFSVVTGKRTYFNMLMKSLSVTTNLESENSLAVEAVFQEILIVSTQVASLSSLPPIAVQQQPQNTADVINTGTQQPAQPNANAAATILGQQ